MTDTTTRTSPANEAAGYALTASFPYLVRRVGLRIGELFDRAVAGYGVDVSMYRVLAALAEVNGQQLGQLSEVTTIELSTLSRLVGTMAGKGLLTRRRPRGNGRIVEISLSAKGRRLAEELMPIAARFEAVAIGGLGAAEVARLKAQLEAAYRNLDAIERELVDSAPAARPARRRRRAPRVEVAV
jgi:DNA-binding MarR family transcriptional regulator